MNMYWTYSRLTIIFYTNNAGDFKLRETQSNAAVEQHRGETKNGSVIAAAIQAPRQKSLKSLPGTFKGS